MKLGPVTKLDNKNTTTLKKFDHDVCQQIVTTLLLFRFMIWSNLEADYPT